MESCKEVRRIVRSLLAVSCKECVKNCKESD